MVYATLRQHQIGERIGETINGTLNGTLKCTLNGTQQTVYDCIKANPGIQAQTIIAECGIPRDTLNKVIRALTGFRLIERRGSKKTGGYYAV